MKFAHMSDIHLGGWRDPKLRELNGESFMLAIDKVVQSKVDFVLISGDLFNTAVPDIESVKLATKQLKRLKDAQIPVYFIAGSHDFSSGGKTMLDVMEHAGLGKNVACGDILPDGRVRLRFTIDQKTGAKITGMIGKRGGLEIEYYKLLVRADLEREDGFKVFMFHSALAELKPKGLEQMDALPVSLLPGNFNYYAGGHVHVVDHKSVGKYENIVYPGPVFPNNFAELEKLQQGSFVMFADGGIEHVPLRVRPVVSLTVAVDGCSIGEADAMIRQEVAKSNLADAVVTIRVFGCLGAGKPADIVWNDVFHDCYAKGAFVVLRNVNALTSKEFEAIVVQESNIEEVERKLLEEHASQLKMEGDVEVARKAMQVLSVEKAEGERVSDFEARLIQESDRVFDR